MSVTNGPERFVLSRLDQKLTAERVRRQFEGEAQDIIAVAMRDIISPQERSRMANQLLTWSAAATAQTDGPEAAISKLEHIRRGLHWELRQTKRRGHVSA